MTKRLRPRRRLPHELEYSAEYGFLLPRLPQRGEAPSSLAGAKRVAAGAQLLALVGIAVGGLLNAPFEVFGALAVLLIAPPVGLALATRRQKRALPDPDGPADGAEEATRSSRSRSN